MSTLDAKIPSKAKPQGLGSNAFVRRLDAIVTLGVPVRVRVEGLKALAVIPPIGTRILTKCLEVLEGRSEKKRYWPLLDLLMIERGIAEQCFPDAPITVEAHMRNAPDWLATSPITCPPNAKGETRRE